MKYLKDLAIMLVIAMIFSVIPACVTAQPADSGNSTAVIDEAEPTATPDSESSATDVPAAQPTEAPFVTDEPEATPTSDPQETPDSSAVPTETPSASLAPTARPNGRYNIAVEETEHANITVSPKTAAKGTRVNAEGTSDRGYHLSRVSYSYTENDAVNEKTLLTRAAHAMDATFSMPEADVTVYSEVKQLSAREVKTDAEEQVEEVTELNSSYTSKYVNNSSEYSSSDVSEMKRYISSARSLITDLNRANEELAEAINLNDLTRIPMENVISIQTELDEVTDKMKSLASQMGGEDVDSFNITISAAKGGRVTVSGLVSGTLNASSKKGELDFENVETDGSTSLSFTISATTGYSLTSFRINNKSVSVTGNKVTIKASAIGSYVKNGYMDVAVNFSYSGFGGGSTGGGGYGGGMTAGYGSNDNSSNTNSNTNSGSMTVPAEGFSDLGDVAWASEAISALSNLGIINGMGDGLFSPQSTVTREQFAKMIVGVMGYSVDQAASTNFSDANGAWYTPYIAAAVNNGIITGRDNGTFGVGENITRQDMAVIIYRALNLSGADIHEFTDSVQISDYAVSAVSALYNMGIISGYTDGSFGPKDNATRAEAAKMLYSVYGAAN